LRTEARSWIGFDVLESEVTAKGCLYGGIVRIDEEKRCPWVAMLNKGLYFENKGLKTLRQQSWNLSRGRDLYCFRPVELLSVEMEMWAPLGLTISMDLLV
jgi:hypothetical protein